MRALSVPELLGVWENGRAQGPVERALALLAAACPETSRDALAALSIGQRDAGLLTLREWMFGPRVDGLAVCRGCGQRLELSFHVADLRVGPERETESGLALRVAGYELQLRPPNSLDLQAIDGEQGMEQKRRLLFERCLVAASTGGEVATPDGLPAEVRDAAEKRLAEADPQADVQLDIACPCGERWRSAFDIVAFFWSEIEAWAGRILREVHVLASAYGWSERDILALTAARRQFYLEMVGE